MATLTDDFNRANSSDLGPNWVEVSGDWAVDSNQLSPGNTGGTIILRAAGAMDSNDHSAQFTIAATTSASQGIWCRGNSNITSGYLWRNSGSSWDLFAVVGGSFNIIGTYAVAAAPGDTAKVQAVGSTIKAYVNGTERVSVTNTDVPTGTSVGIRAESVSGLRFDDFTAADVTAGAALGTATETDSAQPLGATKSAPLSPASASEASQPLVGTKASELGTADETETAPAITATKNRSLGPAATTEDAQPLSGAKSTTLGTAGETDTTRPLTTAGADEDIDVTVGPPYSRWTVSEPSSQPWPVGAPY